MGNVISTAEYILQDGFIVTIRDRFGICISILSFKSIAKLFYLVSRLYDLVITTGIKHCTTHKCPRHTAVDTAICLSLGRKHICCSLQVSIDEVPALVLSGEFLILHDSLKVFVIDYDFFVTFCKLKIHITPHETQFGIQTGLVFRGHFSVFSKIANSLIGLSDCGVKAAPHAHIGIHISCRHGDIVTVSELTWDETCIDIIV